MMRLPLQHCVTSIRKVLKKVFECLLTKRFFKAKPADLSNTDQRKNILLSSEQRSNTSLLLCQIHDYCCVTLTCCVEKSVAFPSEPGLAHSNPSDPSLARTHDSDASVHLVDMSEGLLPCEGPPSSEMILKPFLQL